jgi:voltage-gated potassium channel
LLAVEARMPVAGQTEQLREGESLDAILDPAADITLDERSRRVSKRFEWPMLFFSALVVPAIALENSNLRDPWPSVWSVLNWTIWSAFVVELVVMLIVVPDRTKYLRRHPLDVVIVLLTPPFLPPAVQGARALRLLRVLRLFKFVGVVRVLFSPEGLRYAALLTVLVILGGGVAFAEAEAMRQPNLDAWDGIWWSITTITTVSFGDIKPMTDLGRVISIVVIGTGLGFVALLTAAAADFFIRRDSLAAGGARTELHEHLAGINERLDRIEAALTIGTEENLPEPAGSGLQEKETST